MTPLEHIIYEKEFLKQVIQEDVYNIIQDHVNKFTKNTGVTVTSIHISFIDVTTIGDDYKKTTIGPPEIGVHIPI